MEDIFKTLECNDDVLSFYDKTFKVGHFREEVKKEFSRELNQYLNEQGFGYISIKEMRINLENIIWKSVILHNCELLHLTAKSWQSGKLRIQVSLNRTIVPAIDRRGGKTEAMQIQDIWLEFCPAQPEIEEIPEISQPETSLDELRRIINEVK